MLKIFLNELKRTLLPSIIVNAIGLIHLVLYIWLSQSISMSIVSNIFGMIFTIIILFYIIYTFSYNKKKNEVDYYYSLPVNKKDVFLGKYLFVLTEIFITFIVFLIVSLIMILILFSGVVGNVTNIPIFEYNFGKLILVYFVQFITAIAFFNICLLFYYKGNSVFDGIMYMLFQSAVLFLLELIYDLLPIERQIPMLNTLFVINSSPALVLEIGRLSLFDIIFYISYIIMAILALVYLVFKVNNRYGDDVEKVDDDIIGYNSFVPTGILLFSVLVGLLNVRFIKSSVYFSVPLIVVMIVGNYILFIIKNKGFVIKKKDVLNIIITSVISIAIIVLITSVF